MAQDLCPLEVLGVRCSDFLSVNREIQDLQVQYKKLDIKLTI